MNDKTKLTDETKFPIPVPSTDTGWEAMRKRLDDEMPAAPAIVTQKETEPRSSNKLVRLLLLLLLFFATGFIVMMNRKGRNNKNTKPVVISEKYPATDKTKQDEKINEENKPGGHNNIDDIANALDKKEIDNNSSAAGLAEKKTTAAQQPNKIISESKNHETGLIISKKIKTNRNRNAVVKNKNSQAGKRKWNTINQNADDTSPNDKSITNNRTNTPDSIVQNHASSIASVTKSKTNLEKKSDSIATDTPLPPPPGSGWLLDGGGYWNLQVPTSATGSYFLGANARSQPYRFILPGAWIQAQNEKHLLALEVNPFASNLLPAKAFRTLTTYENIPDTTVVTIQSRTLRKIFGLSAGFGYAYNVSGNWWLGGHVQSFWWRKAVAESNGEIQKYPTNGSPDLIIPVKENYSINDEWSYFSRIQFYLNAEGIYKKSKWQAGFRMGLGITPLAKNDGPSQSLRFELLYRLKLFNIKMTEDKKRNTWIR